MDNQTTNHGIDTLCSKCKMDTKQHFLHNQLTITFCECKKLGGIHIGFTEKPFWKFYTNINKEEFLEFAQSATAYVDVMREVHVYPKPA